MEHNEVLHLSQHHPVPSHIVKAVVTKKKTKNARGFTLIELMIVIVIIGVLAAIAIPQFSAYRQRGFNASAEADLRNAVTAQEAYFVDCDEYADTSSAIIGATYGLYLSEKVQLKVRNASTTSYSMIAWHSAGNASFIVKGPGGSVSKH